MTPKEFDKELTRLSKLMAKAAYAGDHAKCREISKQADMMFTTFKAFRLLKASTELEAAE